jgi:hypothetical protein
MRDALKTIALHRNSERLKTFLETGVDRKSFAPTTWSNSF